MVGCSKKTEPESCTVLTSGVASAEVTASCLPDVDVVPTLHSLLLLTCVSLFFLVAPPQVLSRERFGLLLVCLCPLAVVVKDAVW